MENLQVICVRSSLCDDVITYFARVQQGASVLDIVIGEDTFNILKDIFQVPLCPPEQGDPDPV
ncbi:hypothetical protein [Cytobacillus sp. IB215665]|uniref:hypothetical protein n=1 Tax=Cytobacillus sp. IB215665 TaxID=3097357 RepID=UPI002A0AECCE|nr:hypothetical protein [Cytobacillus sp. IB215665]MDX8366569.1 hypothetical protein [Cytobacillus sp. IB215665]